MNDSPSVTAWRPEVGHACRWKEGEGCFIYVVPRAISNSWAWVCVSHDSKRDMGFIVPTSQLVPFIGGNHPACDPAEEPDTLSEILQRLRDVRDSSLTSYLAKPAEALEDIIAALEIIAGHEKP